MLTHVSSLPSLRRETQERPASIDAGPPLAEWFEVKHTLGG